MDGHLKFKETTLVDRTHTDMNETPPEPTTAPTKALPRHRMRQMACMCFVYAAHGERGGG